MDEELKAIARSLVWRKPSEEVDRLLQGRGPRQVAGGAVVARRARHEEPAHHRHMRERLRGADAARQRRKDVVDLVREVLQFERLEPL